MKGNRDMVYGNYNYGGYQDPNMIINPPSGYNINTQYQAFGPGLYNNQNNNPNIMPVNNDPYDDRITKLERQVRQLDQRLKRLENADISNDANESNMYMI